jgi:hypothetical protein
MTDGGRRISWLGTPNETTTAQSHLSWPPANMVQIVLDEAQGEEPVSGALSKSFDLGGRLRERARESSEIASNN